MLIGRNVIVYKHNNAMHRADARQIAFKGIVVALANDTAKPGVIVEHDDGQIDYVELYKCRMEPLLVITKPKVKKPITISK